METTKSLSNIAAAIIQVMKAVEGIEKNSTIGTGQNQYKGISDKDVKKKVGEAMANAGLCIIQTKVNPVLRVDRWQDQGTGYQKQQVFAEVSPEYLLLHTSGESLSLQGYGHGIDTQDKSAGKATTYALKNTLLYLFMVPTGAIDDTDKTHSDDYHIPPDPILEKLKTDLSACESLEKLQEVYLATTPQYRKLTLALKDQIKEKIINKK